MHIWRAMGCGRSIFLTLAQLLSSLRAVTVFDHQISEPKDHSKSGNL